MATLFVIVRKLIALTLLLASPQKWVSGLGLRLTPHILPENPILLITKVFSIPVGNFLNQEAVGSLGTEPKNSESLQKAAQLLLAARAQPDIPNKRPERSSSLGSQGRECTVEDLGFGFRV